MASPVSEYAEAYTDSADMDIDERILQDSQYNMVEFAKKYFRGAQRKKWSVDYAKREIVSSGSHSYIVKLKENVLLTHFHFCSDSYKKKSKKTKESREPSEMVKFSKV